MKIGDKVYLEDRESEITAISYDETGEKIYTVKDSTKDYYLQDFYNFMWSELHATQNLLEEYKEAYADYQELGKEYAKLQDENEKLKEIDLMIVHMQGVCLEKDRWKRKIKEEMEELDEEVFGKPYDVDTADGKHSQAMGMWCMCNKLLKGE